MELPLVKLFRIERVERSISGMLLFQSVFLGVFYGIFNILAHSIFLSRFDETSLARAYILSGIAGIALTYFYSVARSKLRFSVFSTFNLLFVSIITFALWILLTSRPEPWVVYSLFIMLGPLFIISVMISGDTASRLIDSRKGGQVSRLLEPGIILGMILSSFSVPALLMTRMNTNNIFLISLVSILVALLIQQILIRKYNHIIDDQKYLTREKIDLKVFRKDRYIRSMIIFVILSVLVLFFIQYSFMAVTRIRYPGESEMARFLGFFEGGMMVFALLVYTIVYSHIIRSLGIRITLAISPLIIGIIIIITLFKDSAEGFVTESAGFVFFFVLLALSRFFSRVLNFSVEKPAFNILFETLGIKKGKDAQFALHGTVNEIGVLISGLILTGLGAITFVKLIHFSWIIIIIAPAWFFFALYLYKNYRESVKIMVQQKEFAGGSEIEAERSQRLDSISSSGLFIDNNYFELITNSELQDNIIGNRLLLKLILNKAEQNLNPDILPLLKHLRSGTAENNGLAEKLDSVINNIESTLEKQGFKKRKDLLSTVIESHNRKMHLQAIMSQQTPPVVTDLMRIMRDQDIEIIKETIYITGKFRIKELLPEICEFLDNPYVTRDAYSVLMSFGEESFPVLAAHFYRSSGNVKVRQLILKLFAETGGPKAIEFLLPKISSIHRLLKREAVAGLEKCGYKAVGADRDELYKEIIDIIGLIAWNMSAAITLRNNNDDMLYEAIQEDTQWWTDIMFMILALLYDRNILDKIKENIERRTEESVNYAMEILDIIADNKIKPYLIALLGDMLSGNKVKNLLQFYPGDLPDYKSLVKDLVNKDYNHIGLWTKVCAIRSLYTVPKPEETDFLVALLFGIHRILREEALKFLQDNYEDAYDNCSYRLPKIYRDQLDSLLTDHIKEKELSLNKVLSLSLVFPGIARNMLIELAENVMLVRADQVESMDSRADYIVWNVKYGANNSEDTLHFNWHTTGQELDKEVLENSEEDYYLLYVKSIELFIFNNPEISALLVKHLDAVLDEN